MRATGLSEPLWMGSFRAVAELGQGGMGRVLLAVAPDGRLVAVKQVHPELAEDAGFRARFRREVAASRKVSGAYTAAVLDADTEARTPWLASEFVPGPSLSQALSAAGPLPEEAVRLLAAGLAQALVDVHRAGLVHRDLKPSNVLLAKDGVRVIDFGIARAAEGSTKLTHTGAMVGSPLFMAPEQVQGLPPTGAADVFSLGSTLVMACTGEPPFAGTSVPGVLYNVAHGAPNLEAVPQALRSFIEPCLAKDPAGRPSPLELLRAIGAVTPTSRPWPEAVYRLAAEQRAEIDRLVAGPSTFGAPARPPVPPLFPPAAPPRRKRARWPTGVAAAAVATAVVTAAALSLLGNGAGGDGRTSAPPRKAGAKKSSPIETVPTPGATPLSKVRDKYTQRVPSCKEAAGKVEVPADYGKPSGNIEATGETPQESNQCYWSNRYGDRVVVSWDRHLSQGGKTGAELAKERYESGYASAHQSYERVDVGVGEEAYWQRSIANLYARDVNMRLNVVVESKRYSLDEARNIAQAAGRSALKVAGVRR
ncbi:serine/threonine-protein kinase [Actinomadura macrotermitis]|uniref:Serine/threonine-protein kinase PknD n=1 Tax=Actinomadura macrotermitis TaxID=2585200 RepID=A0A7K0C7G9_9ACTN|nr:serine/threonine-protein kinase [Actinomadura macrotermitis]MQY09286.1 Serine/threonine-protein kinase PknD [Actinomadura macrotermitis]